MSIEIRKVSITDTGLECVVNAANSSLWEGGGVCGYIFSAAGSRELTEACERIGHCDEGSAVITPGFKLSKYIIHAVGPRWIDGNYDEPSKLYGAYKKSLELCKENNIHEVAFPLISAGIFGYPADKAWEQALGSCKDFIEDNKDYNIKILFAALDDDILRIGESLLDRMKAF